MLWLGLANRISWRTLQICRFVGACPRNVAVVLPGPTGQPWIAAEARVVGAIRNPALARPLGSGLEARGSPLRFAPAFLGSHVLVEMAQWTSPTFRGLPRSAHFVLIRFVGQVLTPEAAAHKGGRVWSGSLPHPPSSKPPAGIPLKSSEHLDTFDAYSALPQFR